MGYAVSVALMLTIAVSLFYTYRLSRNNGRLLYNKQELRNVRLWIPQDLQINLADRSPSDKDDFKEVDLAEAK